MCIVPKIFTLSSPHGEGGFPFLAKLYGVQFVNNNPNHSIHAHTLVGVVSATNRKQAICTGNARRNRPHPMGVKRETRIVGVSVDILANRASLWDSHSLSLFLSWILSTVFDLSTPQEGYRFINRIASSEVLKEPSNFRFLPSFLVESTKKTLNFLPCISRILEIICFSLFLMLLYSASSVPKPEIFFLCVFCGKNEGMPDRQYVILTKTAILVCHFYKTCFGMAFALLNRKGLRQIVAQTFVVNPYRIKV